jgi:hypothetical protein
LAFGSRHLDLDQTPMPNVGDLQIADVSVLVVYQNLPGHDWLVAQAERGDNDLVAHLYTVCSRPIDYNLAGSFDALDHIGLKSLAVINVPYMDQFTDDEAGPLDQVSVDRNAAYIIDVGIGNGGSVDFALEQVEKAHSRILYQETWLFVSPASNSQDQKRQMSRSDVAERTVT